MDGLEGVLLVPPERSHILGRPAWKPRYVTVGRRIINRDARVASQTQPQPQPHPQTHIAGRGNSSISKPPPKTTTEEYCISVYKFKDDCDAIQEWPLSWVSDCQVQILAHRKQGPVLPTLVVTLTDRERKRRSSRVVGLVSSNKESGSITLWFRAPSDDLQSSLHEWSRCISYKKTFSNSHSPSSPNFAGPVGTRSRDNSEFFSHSGSGIRHDGRALHHKSSTATYSTGPRDRPITFSSDSPSLKSKRSDVSSPASSSYNNHKLPLQIPGQHYTTVLPTDILPSTGPGTVIEYHGDFIEGWTSAQGRSLGPAPVPSSRDPCAPPAPGETILDRAFKLGHIPGMSADIIPGEDKLSSIARFDALMREADERRKRREAAEQVNQMAMRSTFDDDDSSEEADSQDSDEESEVDYSQQHSRPGKENLITPTAQRALEFIAGRHEPTGNTGPYRPGVSRAHLSFHADTRGGESSQGSSSRPHTAHGKGRPDLAHRTQSTPHLAAFPIPPGLEVPLPPGIPAEDSVRSHNGGEKRHSSSSTKRLSFTGFTKRLSSTSSLLLVQTNASGGSSRGSVEIDTQPSSAPRTNLTYRGPAPVPPPRTRDRDDQGRMCAWRGGVGVANSDNAGLV